jgi:beta-lactamase superfamily II metal-dependent hydrolase
MQRLAAVAVPTNDIRRSEPHTDEEANMGKMHNLDVGCADATVIISNRFTFLVDCEGIEQYSNLLPAAKHIRGVFITHQHRDHFSGLDYLRQNDYSINCLIYSPYIRRRGDNSVELDEWNDFSALRDYFEKQGTALRTPYRQDAFDKPYWEIDGLKFWMLGPNNDIANSETRELHDASLVFQADLGNRKCVFTGDASDSSLNWIANNTKGIGGDILHASHHGSINGADLDFIKKCSPAYTVISTASGVHESVPDATALRRYNNNTKQRVYRTDNDGTITWNF